MQRVLILLMLSAAAVARNTTGIRFDTETRSAGDLRVATSAGSVMPQSRGKCSTSNFWFFDATLYAMIPFSLRRLFIVFLRVGNLTFGGGDPTMAALHQELVVSRGWLAADRYSLIYSLARATPGTNVLAFCAGVGWQLALWRGALLTLMAASIPCSALVVWFTYAYGVWRTSHWAMAAIGGMLAAAAGMTAAAGWQLVRPHWKPGRRFRAAVIASGAFALAYWFSFSPLAILALGALSGLAWRTPS